MYYAVFKHHPLNGKYLNYTICILRKLFFSPPNPPPNIDHNYWGRVPKDEKNQFNLWACSYLSLTIPLPPTVITMGYFFVGLFLEYWGCQVRCETYFVQFGVKFEQNNANQGTAVHQGLSKYMTAQDTHRFEYFISVKSYI